MTKPDYKDSPIAIIGLGGNFPDASHVEQFWKNICEGHVAIGEVPAELLVVIADVKPYRRDEDKTHQRVHRHGQQVEGHQKTQHARDREGHEQHRD